jgi:hypothetical protein
MRRAFAEWRFVASDAVRRRAARAAVADARRARAQRARGSSGAIGGASRAMGETTPTRLAASVVSSGSRERARTTARVGRGQG